MNGLSYVMCVSIYMLVFILAPHINAISLSVKSSIKIKGKKKKEEERKKERKTQLEKKNDPLLSTCEWSILYVLLAKIGEFG
jgi:hypothetical protein